MNDLRGATMENDNIIHYLEWRDQRSVYNFYIGHAVTWNHGKLFTYQQGRDMITSTLSDPTIIILFHYIDTVTNSPHQIFCDNKRWKMIKML